MANTIFPDFPQERAEGIGSYLAQSLREWAASEVMGKRLELREDYERLLQPAMNKLFVDIEMQKLIWPEEYGGAGENGPEVIFTLLQALEEIGRADTGIGYVTAATFALWTTFALKPVLNDQLCGEFAPLFCRAEEAVTASLVLPQYGRDGSAAAREYRGRYLQAAAKKEGLAWVVNGAQIRPFNSGADAALFGVLCRLEGEEEPGFILIPAAAQGVNRDGVIPRVTGLAAGRNASLYLDQVRVPAGNLVFQGDGPYRNMLSWLYAGCGAVALGSLSAAFEIIKEWGDTRVIKGKGNIFKHNPLTASVMAEASHEILLSRLLIQRLAQIFSAAAEGEAEAPERLFVTALSVASHITRAAEKAINRIMELMGSAGYATEWNLERYWRDVKTMQLHLGSWELNKMEIAGYFYGSKTY